MGIEWNICSILVNRRPALQRVTGCSRSELVKTLVDEGLRMTAHPGIAFRSGPDDVRPGLVAGPDVWEVARVFQGVRGDIGAVIDAWIARIDEEAERQEEAWLRQQALLRR
jgi:hypothetical protein